MGPVKVVVKGNTLYDAKSGKLIQDGLSSRKEQQDYAARHYIALPVLDNAGRPWILDKQPVYLMRGVRYETLDDQVVHLARCPDCGGMGVNAEGATVERDCIRCIQCGHEFDARLEMMES